MTGQGIRKLAAELFGTFALVFAGTGAIVINDVSGGTVTHVGIAFTFGLIVLSFNGKDADVAVTMGCGDECPLVVAKRRVDWQIPDPRNMAPDQFREVRNLIEAKVKDLIETL